MKSTITYETAADRLKLATLEEMRQTFPHYHIVEDSLRFLLHPTDPLSQGREVLVVSKILPVRYTGELIDLTTTQLGCLEDWEAVFGRKFNGDYVTVRWGDLFWQNRETPCLQLNYPLSATHVQLMVWYKPPKAGNTDPKFLHQMEPVPGLEYMCRQTVPGLEYMRRQTCPNAPEYGVDTYLWWIPGSWYFDLNVVRDPPKLLQLKTAAQEQVKRRLNEVPKRANGSRDG